MFALTHRIGFAAGQAATPGSPLLTTLLLNHFNGSDAATTFTDEVGGVTWTRIGVGVNELDTALKKFGSAAWKGQTDGGFTDGRAKATGFNLDGTGSFTLQVFGAVDTIASAGGIVEVELYDTTDLDTQIGYMHITGANGDNGYRFSFTPTTGGPHTHNNVSAGLSINTFYHLAMVRDHSAGTYEFFFNSNRVATFSNASDFTSCLGLAINGYALNSGTFAGGWLDEIRLTDGAEYGGATYTVPTGEFS